MIAYSSKYHFRLSLPCLCPCPLLKKGYHQIWLTETVYTLYGGDVTPYPVYVWQIYLSTVRLTPVYPSFTPWVSAWVYLVSLCYLDNSLMWESFKADYTRFPDIPVLCPCFKLTSGLIDWRCDRFTRLYSGVLTYALPIMLLCAIRLRFSNRHGYYFSYLTGSSSIWDFKLKISFGIFHWLF